MVAGCPVSDVDDGGGPGRVCQRGGNWPVAEVAAGHAAAVAICAGSMLMIGAMSSAIGSVCM